MLKILIVFKKLSYIDDNDVLYDSFTLLFSEIYLCELNILFTFHYMIFKSEDELNIKRRQL